MTDALERIKNRQRPEVPKRDPGLTPTVPEIIDNSMSGKLDTSIPIYPDIQISTLPGTEVSPPTIEVKQTTLRLEKAIGNELQALCQREQICREVLIEAMFLAVINTPEVRERVLIEARERQRKRTAVANHKRAMSMVQRLAN